MEFHNKKSQLIIPKGNEALKLSSTTHLGIGAHPDDNEIKGYHGIGTCYKKDDQWYMGVVLTDGAGGTKNGVYAALSSNDLIAVRRRELEMASNIGDFLALANLNYTSDELKESRRGDVTEDLIHILEETQPEIVYVHNLFDEHDTHVAAALSSIDALREVSSVFKPKHVYGCEVTEGLDWYSDKVRLDVSMHPEIARAILYIFISQSDISRNYPHATLSRWDANAVFDRDNKEGPSSICFAMELTELVHDLTSDIGAFVDEKGQEFRERKKRNLRDMIKS